MGPAERYQQDLLSETFSHDVHQQHAVGQLQTLYEELLANESQKQPGWIQKLFHVKTVQPIQGLYIWGDTGRGKTYLMDSFYACVPFREKYRVHFHRFMLDIHEQLRQLPKSPDPLVIVAKQLATKYRLLCLDEFHVHDIADAMLMAGLLKALFQNGVTLVATSNISIDNLYKNGLQRERFIHAIELLHRFTKEVELGDGNDYRFSSLEKNETYQVADLGTGQTRLQVWFDKMAVVSPKHNRSITINNRPIEYIALADDLVWFDFRELCATYRSANDYIEIAKTCSTVFISDIHRMTDEHDNIAKRFIHLIDALYDHQVKLVATAEVLPSKLYTGKRLAFAFKRTSSRLTEMATNHYLSLEHI